MLGEASKVLVDLVDSNASAIWKSSVSCLPPHGRGFDMEYLVKLVEAADSALQNSQVHPPGAESCRPCRAAHCCHHML